MSQSAVTPDFEEFFTATSPSLVGQAYVLTGNLQEAQDLVQEAMLRAWREWPKVSHYDDPAGWARRVVHNLAVSRWRRAELRRRHEQAEHVTVALSLSPEPPDAHLDLVAALGRLPVRHRQAVVLHDVVGLTAEEVGRELGVPASTVRAWLSRAHRRLEKEVEL